MSQNPRFWKGFKHGTLIVFVLTIIASLLLFIFLEGNAALLFGGMTAILALNIGLIYFFIRVNDNRRPMRGSGHGRSTNKNEEHSRFQFRKDDSYHKR